MFGLGQLALIPPEDLMAIRSLIDLAIEGAEEQSAIISGEYAAIFQAGPGQIPELVNFSVGELATQIVMDASEVSDAVEALSRVTDEYGTDLERGRVATVLWGLSSVGAGIPLGTGTAISQDNKDTSLEHLRKHFIPVVDATAEVVRRISSVEGAAAVPIGMELEPPGERRGPGQTVVEEEGFPWLLLVVFGTAIALGS